jgi:hypothetical protein
VRRPTIPTFAARLVAAVSATVLAACLCASSNAAVAPIYHTTYRPGKIVRVDGSVPHARGVMVDRRVLPDLRYLAQTYPIYVTEGYAGPLRGFGQVGCPGCHVSHSDHLNGLAVDIVPLHWDGGGCDRSWRPITRLARWAEPRQNRPRLPFRWVGYSGDYNHGCGNHLHLSWNHASAKRFRLASWVMVFEVPFEPGPPVPQSPPPPPPVPTPGPSEDDG